MHAYFEQFGTIKHLSLIRSKKSGKPKGYAFIQFDEPAVAAVVATTMHGYPLMEKVLKSHVVPPEKVHAGMFMNADRHWKRIPWRRIVREAQRRPKTEEQVVRRVGRLLQRETAAINKLKDLGIDYEFSNTYMKQADDRELFNNNSDNEDTNDNDDNDSVSDDDEEIVPVTNTKPTTTKPSSIAKGKKEPETVDTSLLPPVPKSIVKKSVETTTTTKDNNNEPKKSVNISNKTTVQTIPNTSRSSLSAAVAATTAPVKSATVSGKKRSAESMDSDEKLPTSANSTTKTTKATALSTTLTAPTASSTAKGTKVAKTTASTSEESSKPATKFSQKASTTESGSKIKETTTTVAVTNNTPSTSKVVADTKGKRVQSKSKI